MTAPADPLRQRLGRRLSPTAYYRVVHSSDTTLELASLPQANRPAGLRIAAVGAAMLAISLAVLISGVTAVGQNIAFNSVAPLLLVGGLVGGIGIQQLTVGVAVATTRNRLSVADGRLTIEQTSRIGRPRSQTIDAAAIRAVRLQRRPLLVGTLVRRRIEVVALELVVGPDQVWILDADRDAAALQVTALALIHALGLSAPDA